MAEDIKVSSGVVDGCEDKTVKKSPSKISNKVMGSLTHNAKQAFI